MDIHALPVYQHKEDILNALGANQCVVVESPTGSGKTTQLPVILHEAGYDSRGMIGVTQPRRIAALSVSEFIANQLSRPLGSLVGYKMRFEDKTGPDTKIKILTDGMLLQEMKLDPYLSRYQVIMVDEAHERSLNIDFILGLLKRVLEARKDFKVIVSSATINAQVFSEYFNQCPIVKIEAETFPVSLIYDPVIAEKAEEALVFKIEQIVERVVDEGRQGDILIFLPGEKVIKECMLRLNNSQVRSSLHVIPLYARLGKEEQDRIFEPAPAGKVKIIVSTNIAETSVTIDGITTVIDSGLAKLSFYNNRSFTTSLIESPISKASCNQRKGRAGRTRPGTCYRLYPRKDFESRPLFTTEEIYRTDLSEVVLRMAELGIRDFEDFDFISKPGRDGIHGAIESLNLLDALEADCSLSSIGKMMCAFPLLPRHSRILVEAIQKYPRSLEDCLVGTAFLTTQSPFILPPGEETEARAAHHTFRDPAGDFVSYLRIFRSYKDSTNKRRFCERSYLDERAMAEIDRVKEQLGLIVSDIGIPILSGGGVADYLCAISRGLIQFVAVYGGREGYRTLTADRIVVHPGSIMFRESPRFIVAGEIVRTTRTYAMSVSPLQRDWLEKISPLLAERLGGFHLDGQKSERGTPERDFTTRVRVLDKVFPIEKAKGGKKMAVLDWEELRALRQRLIEEPLTPYKDLRACVRYGNYDFLVGEKLDLILRLSPFLEIDKDLKRPFRSTSNFNIENQSNELLGLLRQILKLVRVKDKSDELGFVCLHSNGEGDYWFRASRGFHTALNESLASIESLIDEVGTKVSAAQKEEISTLYRRLSSYLS